MKVQMVYVVMVNAGYVRLLKVFEDETSAKAWLADGARDDWPSHMGEIPHDPEEIIAAYFYNDKDDEDLTSGVTFEMHCLPVEKFPHVEKDGEPYATESASACNEGGNTQA